MADKVSSWSSAGESFEEWKSFPPVDPSILERMLDFGRLNLETEALQAAYDALTREHAALKAEKGKVDDKIINIINKKNKLEAENTRLKNALRETGRGWGGAGAGGEW